MKKLYLMTTIAGEDVAIPAHQVESVVKVRDIVKVPSVKPYVSGLFALRSRVLTLIDCQYFISGESAEVKDRQTAIVAQISGHFYGFLVDAVKDVIEPQHDESELPTKLSDAWQSIGSAMLSVDGKSTLVVDPRHMIEPVIGKAA